jgi:uncharacterized sulfatase
MIYSSRNPFSPVACAGLSATVALGASALAAQTAPAEIRNSRPNVIFILADDLGWRDLGCYGNDLVDTPNLDALAKSGMRFTQAYAYPTCSPTRVSLMTGDYPSRHGMALHWNTHRRGWERLGVPPSPHALSPNVTSLADLVKSRGYAATLIGKWHLGYNNNPFDLDKVRMPPGMGPKTERVAFGFQRPPSLEYKGIGAPYEKRLQDFYHANPHKNVGDHTLQAVRFMEQNRDKPFFCFLSYHTVHVALAARPELIAKYSRRVVARNAMQSPVYLGMMEAMDESVGLVLEALKELNLDKNTVIIFASDNGGVIQDYHGMGAIVTTNHPLRGQKASLWEGGLRVPWIARWPGKIAPGSECNDPIICTDFFPTLAGITGANLPEKYSRDGRSLVPLLKGTAKTLPARALFWHLPSYVHITSSPSSAIREGDYKLIEFLQDDHVELYNIATDIGENENLTAKMPELASSLRDKLHKWRTSIKAEMPPPNPDYDPDKAHIWTVRPRRPWDIPPLKAMEAAPRRY